MLSKLIQILAVMVMVGVVSCKEEAIESPNPLLVPVTVEFGEDIIVFENDGLKEIVLEFDSPSQIEGTISLLVGPENLDGIDIPDISNSGKIDISIVKGATSAKLIVEIVDNEKVNDQRVITINIEEVSEGFEIGLKKTLTLELIDDEMYGKLKSFSSTYGITSSNRSIEYDEFGRIHKVNWENRGIHVQSGTDTYSYENGQLSSIHFSDVLHEKFFWENGKIAKSERFQSGVKQSYFIYSYDGAGNIGEEATFSLQSDGSYLMSVVFVYLYFTDGNLNKILTYVPEEEGFKWISTRTYDDYINKPNSNPYEVVPTISAQNKLPGFYKIETETSSVQNTYNYDFDEAGMLVKRSIIETGEIAEYQHH